MVVEVQIVDVFIRMLGIVRFEKQTDGTRRRTLRADPDVASGSKELITLKDYNILSRKGLVHRGCCSFLGLGVMRLKVFCNAVT
jgi:hypothetical protein